MRTENDLKNKLFHWIEEMDTIKKIKGIDEYKNLINKIKIGDIYERCYGRYTEVVCIIEIKNIYTFKSTITKEGIFTCDYTFYNIKIHEDNKEREIFRRHFNGKGSSKFYKRLKTNEESLSYIYSQSQLLDNITKSKFTKFLAALFENVLGYHGRILND